MAEYIVWQPECRVPPTVRFKDRPTAIKVATRMASQDPGKTFLVCKIVGEAVWKGTSYTDHEAGK